MLCGFCPLVGFGCFELVSAFRKVLNILSGFCLLAGLVQFVPLAGFEHVVWFLLFGWI